MINVLASVAQVMRTKSSSQPVVAEIPLNPMNSWSVGIVKTWTESPEMLSISLD